MTKKNLGKILFLTNIAIIIWCGIATERTSEMLYAFILFGFMLSVLAVTKKPKPAEPTQVLTPHTIPTPQPEYNYSG